MYIHTAHIYTYMYTSMNRYTCTHTCMYIWMYTYVYTYTHIYTWHTHLYEYFNFRHIKVCASCGAYIVELRKLIILIVKGIFQFHREINTKQISQMGSHFQSNEQYGGQCLQQHLHHKHLHYLLCFQKVEGSLGVFIPQ